MPPHLDKSSWLIQERTVIDFRGSATAHLGNFPMLKLFQVLKTVMSCDLLVCCREEVKWILNYLKVWKLDWIASKDLLRRMGWSMIATSMMGTNPMEISNNNCSKMNVLLWNCRDALNSYFKRRVFEMAINHFPSIMIITETRVGGDRAARIHEDLPFDGFFVTETIGYVGGLWLLWKKKEVDVFVLSSTEQEIHATVKVRDSDLTWLISPVYASLRIAERKILWENLTQVAQLHNMPWLLLGDFNEVLSSEDKFGGRSINLIRVKSVWILATFWI